MKLSSLLKNTILFFFILFFTSCYSVRLIGDGPGDSNLNGEEQTQVIKHSIAWGLKTEIEPDRLCPSGTFQEVDVKSNLLFSLINVASFGFWKPVKICYTCAKKEG